MGTSRKLPPLFRPPLDYPEQPLHGHLKVSLARCPDKVALVDGEIELTFRELDHLSNACAHAFLEAGIAKGDRIAIFLPNSAAFEIAFYGASKAGAVVTALNPSYKEGEVRYQLADSGAKLLITEPEKIPLIESVRKDLPDLKEIILWHGGESVYPDFESWILSRPISPPPEPDLDLREDLAALPYSSGTTGLPKGVMLTHRNLVTNHYVFNSNLRITEQDVGLLFLPLYHIFGSLLMGGFTLAGVKQVLMPRFEVEAALRLVEEHRVTLFFTVPPALLAILHHPHLESYDLSSLRFMLSGAAPLPPEVRHQVEKRTGVMTFMGYGLTETAPITHTNPEDKHLIKADSIGPPCSDVEQKIMDTETGERELPVGEAGELVLRGPNVMKGYWKAPEETAQVLRDGWFYTGDIAKVDEEGYVYILDRKKEMIKYKGFSVAPAELEAILHQHPEVADAAVVGKPDAEAGEIPKAFVVPKPEKNPAADALMAFVRDKVAGYKQVREVEFIDQIPKSPSGKILRRILKERA